MKLDWVTKKGDAQTLPFPQLQLNGSVAYWYFTPPPEYYPYLVTIDGLQGTMPNATLSFRFVNLSTGTPSQTGYTVDLGNPSLVWPSTPSTLFDANGNIGTGQWGMLFLNGAATNNPDAGPALGTGKYPIGTGDGPSSDAAMALLSKLQATIANDASYSAADRKTLSQLLGMYNPPHQIVPPKPNPVPWKKAGGVP
jgi:hypothetical protein